MQNLKKGKRLEDDTQNLRRQLLKYTAKQTQKIFRKYGIKSKKRKTTRTKRTER